MADGTATPETDPQDSDVLGENGKKALEAERRNARTAARERDALAAKLKEFEDKDKTEIERATARAEAAEQRAASLEARALRLEVAAEQGLTIQQAKRLVGETREELEADAKELLETFRPAEAHEVSTALDNLDLGPRGGPARPKKSNGELFAAAIEGSFTR